MSSYLTGRETHLLFQNHVMGPIDITQGLGQGSCLSPILSGIYIAPALHRWSPVARVGQQNLSLQFFVDDGLFHAVGKDLEVNTHFIARAYKALSSHLYDIGLEVGEDKFELVHFRRGRKGWDPELPSGPPIKLHNPNGRPIEITPQEKVRYLGFFLDSKL